MNKLSSDLDFIVAHTRELWEELRQRRLFITGGTGFFGCWLLESFCYANRLLHLDAEVVVLTRNPQGFVEKCPHLGCDSALTLLEGDVRSFVFPDGEFGYVIHAATEASAKQSTEAPLEMLSTIVAGTEHVLEFAVSHGTRKLLLTSSGAVYGKQPSALAHVPESFAGGPDQLDPANVYAEGKRTSELLCAIYQKRTGLECKIARCWAFCGPYLPLDRHFAIGNFIGDALAGRPIDIRGDGQPKRSYLYAADLAIWLWTLLFRAPAMVPFNVGSSHAVSVLELAHVVAETLNPGIEIRVGQSAPSANPRNYVPSVDLAQELLGLREIVGLEESIRRTARWHAK